MVTVSNLVKKYIQEKPLLQEAMIQGIVSFGALAERLRPSIEKELNKEIKLSAVVMALRRHSEKLSKRYSPQKFDYSSEVSMKTNLCDINVLRSSSVLSKIKRIRDLVDYERGDVLNIIHSSNEISIISNQKFLTKIKKILTGEKIINIEENLVSISLRFSEKFYYTPGVLATIFRKISWEGINIFEVVSTFTELTLIIDKKDATKCYTVLESLIEEEE